MTGITVSGISDRSKQMEEAMMTAAITGSGSALPEKTVTNRELEQILDTSDSWIRERTGIRERRLAVEETASELAVTAAKRALENAGKSGAEVELILTATGSADQIFPCLSCQVQGAIGAVHAAAFDINAACTGFLAALNTAWAYLRSGLAKNALVIGAEVMSRLVDWTDRGTCILFGDGAGAVFLEASGGEGIRDILLGADGARGSVLTCGNRNNHHPFLAEPAEEKEDGYLHMDGKAVYQFAVTKVPEIVTKLTERNGEKDRPVNWYILHQANERIIRSIAKRLGEPIEKFPMNVQVRGNLSAASIPVLLDEWSRSGRLRCGDRMVLAGFGAGLTFGAALLQWTKH